jgi:endonuclease I
MACGGENLHEKVFSETLITFSGNDEANHVTGNITVKKTSETVPDAQIVWTSSDSAVISIQNNVGIVTRQPTDMSVSLSLTVSIGNLAEEKVFSLTVIKADQPAEDHTAPIISGATDFTIAEGSPDQDWLEGVSATDDVDGDVPVNIFENTVDLNQAGVYQLIYEAFDKAGNRGTVTVTVTVTKTDTEPVLEKTFSEKFDSLNATGSSYANISFTGIEGIVWTITGSRGDQTLDGKAVTFGGKIDNSKLSATIPGGITDFSVDVKKAFTNTNPRELELFINGISQGTYSVDPVSEQVSSFTVENINVAGQFTLELRHISGDASRAQIVIDNLRWTSYSGNTVPVEKQNLDHDLSDLVIITSFMEPCIITLPEAGSHGSSIVWSYLDVGDVNNQLIDLLTHEVSVPQSGQQTVKLLATLTNGSFQATKTFHVLVGEGEPVSITDVRKAPDGSRVKTQGTITSYYETSEGLYFFLQDAGSGIFVQAPLTYGNAILNGNVIVLIGEKSVKNGQVMLKQITKLSVTGSDTLTPFEINDPAIMKSYPGVLVRMSGLLRQTYTDGSLSFSLINPYGTFLLTVPNGMTATVKMGVESLLMNKDAGLSVTATACVYQNMNSYELLITDAGQLSIGSALEPDRVAEVLASLLKLPDVSQKVSSNLILPVTSGLISGISISWSSSNEAVLSSAGIIHQQDADVFVELTYEIMLGGLDITSGHLDFIVAPKSTYEGYYASINGLSGTSLKEELKRIISQATSISYTNTSYVLDDTDADPLHPGNVLLVYNRASVSGAWNGSTWNKEHIWPQSKLGTASVSDLFNLRPSNPAINSSRGNLPYVDGTGSYGARSGGWYPGDQEKGDIARAVFYMNTRWALSVSTSSVGDLNMFIRWNMRIRLMILNGSAMMSSTKTSTTAIRMLIIRNWWTKSMDLLL